MKYRTILIDDEPLALRRLKRLLKVHENVIDIVGTASDGEEALDNIAEHDPDLIFLDIQMPGMNGFEVIGNLESPPLIIFCTAYDEYALKAFETSSIDYLLKPVEPARLSTAIDKLERLTSIQREDTVSRLSSLLSQMRNPQARRIKVAVGDSVLFLNIDDICFFRASDKYVEAHTLDSTHLLTKTLQELETELPPEDFVRIHRSTIINLNHADKAIRWFGGKYKIRMKDADKTELDISRSAKGKLGL